MRGAVSRVRSFTVLVAAVAIAAGLLVAVAVPASATSTTPPKASVPAPLKADGKSPVKQSSVGLPADQTARSVPSAKGFDAAKSRVSSRTANATDYANVDGSHTLQASPTPVNFQGADGSWQSINNKLKADPDQPGGLTNTANSWHVHFGTTSQGVAVDTASAGSIAVAPIAAANVTPVASSDGTQVTYPSAWPNVDLVYTVAGGEVKESLMIKSAAAGVSFAFAVRSGSEAQVLAAGRVRAAQDSTKFVQRADGAWAAPGPISSQFEIMQPVVLGADGIPLTNAGAQIASGPGELIVSVDPTWLQSQPASAFPINVDPSMSAGPANSSCYLNTGTTLGNCGIMIADSRISNGNTDWRSQIHYPYESLFGSTILGVDVSGSRVAGTANGYWVNVYSVTTGNFNGSAGTSPSVAFSSTGNNTFDLSGAGLTNLVAGWVNARMPGGNLGFIGNEDPNTYTYQQFNSVISITYDHAPGAAPQSGSSPAPGAVVSSTTPLLSVPPASDPDNDAVNYDFTISGAGAESGRASSGWITTNSWAVPAGIVADGESYTWSVSTSDGPTSGPWMVTPNNWTSTFLVNERLGATTISPTDSLAGATANLANGNVTVSVASHSVNTVGGSLARRSLITRRPAKGSACWGSITRTTTGRLTSPPQGRPRWCGSIRR